MRSAHSLTPLLSRAMFFVLVSLLLIGQAQAVVQVVASDTVRASNDTDLSALGSWVVVSTIIPIENITGTVRFYGYDYVSNDGYVSYYNIFKNDIAIGTQRTDNGGTAWDTAPAENISIMMNTTDILSIKILKTSGIAGHVRNFRLMYDLDPQIVPIPELINGTVVLTNTSNITQNSVYLKKVKTITLSSSFNASNYQVPLTISSLGLPATTINYNDTRFVWLNSTSGSYEILPHYNDSGIYFWVNLSVVTGYNTIFMFYNNSNFTYDNFVGSQRTFPLYDDFNNGTTLNTSIWTAFKSGSANAIVDVSSGYINLSGEQNVISSGSIRSVKNFTNNVSIEFSRKYIVSGGVQSNYRSFSFGAGATPVGMDSGTADSWWQTGLNQGYHGFVQNEADAGFYYMPASGGGTIMGTDFAPGTGTSYETHKFTYLNNGSLNWYMNGVLKQTVTNTTWNNTAKGILIAQGEYSNGNGGYTNIDWAFVRNWNGSDVSTQSIGTEYSTSPGIPNITQGCNSYHGCGVNTSIAQVGSLDNIDFNITYTGLATSVDWYKNNILIQSSLSTTLSTILHLSPAVNNISVIVKNGYQNSVVFYWLFNTTEYSYSGNTPKNLSRLQRPSKTQMQYIYGNSTGFFNMSSSWIVNSTDKSISGSSIKTNPMSLWVRPIDGILNINTKQYSTGSTVLKVYVNSSLYGTYDLNDVISLDTTISLTLNPLNISNITITSDSDDNFLLYSINFNRSYPALYDGNNYFQIKRMYYEFGINQSPWNHEWTYRTYNQTLYQTDLNDINNLSFNSIGVPLIWGEIVDNINATSGISNNIYNASSLQILDWMIDNASINNKYIFLQFVTWAGWSGNQERPLGVYRTLSGYPCSTCLVNSSEASSISEMFIYLSNRYKNHTNVIFELPDEGLVEGDYTDSGWYANSQNVASWQAYSGYGDANLPHNSGYSDAKFKSLWQWEQQKFFELNNAIIPTIHLNNQLFTNYYWTKTPSPVAYQEYVSRLNNNISDADFVGIVEYPDISSSIIQLDNYYYNVSLNFIPFGSISYMAGIGINTNYTYTANRSNIVNQVFSKIITNISVVDYANQSVGYNLAGYSYWFYRETSMCPSFQVGNTCWGIKYKNDTNVSWRNDIQTLNLKFVLGLDYNSPSSITNPQTTTGNFFINNTWTDPADADFDYVYFVWSNGTSMNRNQTKGNQSLNLTYSPHYTQNISAQTVDTSGNINNTKVWFNATIPNNPITISGVNASYSLTEGQYLLIDANYSDLDSDTGTFSDNATEWDVNTSTGIVNWTAVIGNYNWQINVSDGYGSVSTQNFTVTVSSGNYMPPTPINLANTSGNYWVNYSWEAGSGNITNSYNVSVNGTWTNNSIPYRNTTVAPHGWSNISVYAFNNSGTGTLNQTPASMNTQVPNNVPTISFIVPTPANNSVNTTGSVQINTSVSDADSDNMTALLNWNNSFVGWWRMNEAAGGTLVQDFSGRGNNGIWNGNTTANVTTGQFGNALAFDGVNDYVDIPNNVISTGSDMTIEAWFITKNNTIEQNILSNNNGGIGRFDFKATSINNGNAYLFIFIGNTSNFLFYGTHIISNNVWNHAVAVRSNSYWFLYLNGSLDNSSVLTLNTIDISKDLQIGGNPSLAGYFNGSIDEVRIYNRALSASEINASYNAGSYRLNETFLGLSDRTYNYTAFIQDAHGTIGQTEIRYVTVNAQPPASITGLTNTTGNFWHNWTWTNPVDADFNYTSVYINGSFVINTSNKYYNLTANAHNQSTISTHTVDIVGNVNQTWVNHTSIIPNNLPVMNTIGNKQVTSGQWLNFTVNATDADSDTITYGTNANKGTLNTTTGNYNWSTTSGDVGTYYWNFNSSDTYSGVDDETILVTVNAALVNVAEQIQVIFI